MNKQITLCGKCIHSFSNAYKVAEIKGRSKITCECCGKRAYGTLCEVKKL